MAIDAQEVTEKYLAAFKTRMRVFDSDEEEDKNLSSMLSASIKAVANLTGATEASEGLLELAFERARYVYYDALDEFQKNYADEIETLYLTNKYKDIEEPSHD
ncbi:hypothetical protein [Streptococcus pyogenes]|uniref:hypothetical protein n=1 Tax=Streptococcus pyogenes TaxID=1314 RepID=UPI0010A10B77|nr:hypothetical protein [Streptococcus pyogenes]VGV54813.1 Uncharacterised protein [Streptococcus pyogenes]HEQ9666876.1 hypothetical protein [Streptococcus pyogenes]